MINRLPSDSLDLEDTEHSELSLTFMHCLGREISQSLLSLVELLDYCALIGRERHSDEIFHKEAAQGTQSQQSKHG